MALAVLFSLCFYFGEIRTKKKATPIPMLNAFFYMSMILFFAVGTILTRSREAFLAVLLPSYIMMFHSRGRTKKKIAIFLTFLMIVVIIPFTRFSEDIDALRKRFSDVNELMTLSDRTPIWSYTWDILTSDPKTLLFGVGTGSVDKVLGARDVHVLGAKLGSEGIVRRNVHNAFLEWIVSYGFVGFLFGGLLLYVLVERAWILDRRHSTAFRRALVLFFLLNAVVSVVYRSYIWPALGSYLLAALTDSTPQQSVRGRTWNDSSKPR